MLFSRLPVVAPGVALLSFLMTGPLMAQAPNQPRLLYPGSFAADVNYREINFQWEAPAQGAPPVEEWVILVGRTGTELKEVARIDDPEATTALVPVSLSPATAHNIRLVAVNSEGETPSFTLTFTTAASIDPITVATYPESVEGDKVTYLAEVTENIDGAAPGGVALRLEWDPDRLENVVVSSPPSTSQIMTSLPFSFQPPATVNDHAINVIGSSAENSRRRGVFMQVNANIIQPIDSLTTPALTVRANPGVDDAVISSGGTSAKFPVEFVNGNALPPPVTPQLGGATATVNDVLHTARDNGVLPHGTSRPSLEFVAGGLGRNWDIYFWPDGQARPAAPLTNIVTYVAARDLHRVRLTSGQNPTPGRWYRWQVVVENSSGTTESPAWRFMVAEAPPSPAEVAAEVLGQAAAVSDLNADGVVDAADIVEALQ